MFEIYGKDALNCNHCQIEVAFPDEVYILSESN